MSVFLLSYAKITPWLGIFEVNFISKAKFWDNNDSYSHFRIVLIMKIRICVDNDQKTKDNEQIQDRKVWNNENHGTNNRSLV